MANEQQGAVRDLKNLKMERDRLYLEEVITDLAAGTIRRMTPLKADGTPDASRQTLYMGQAQVLSAMGPLPVQFELEAGQPGGGGRDVRPGGGAGGAPDGR